MIRYDTIRYGTYDMIYQVPGTWWYIRYDTWGRVSGPPRLARIPPVSNLKYQIKIFFVYSCSHRHPHAAVAAEGERCTRPGCVWDRSITRGHIVVNRTHGTRKKKLQISPLVPTTFGPIYCQVGPPVVPVPVLGTQSTTLQLQ